MNGAEKRALTAGLRSPSVPEATVRVPPPLFIVLPLALGWALDTRLPPAPLPADVRPVGGVLLLLGLTLVAWAVRAQAVAGTNPDVRTPTTALVVVGPYALSRNPIYLGFVIGHAGIALLLLSTWALAAAVPAAVLLHRMVILREEAFLREQFGDLYDQYCARVRRWV